jgi:hypothetical protein
LINPAVALLHPFSRRLPRRLSFWLLCHDVLIPPRAETEERTRNESSTANADDDAQDEQYPVLGYGESNPSEKEGRSGCNPTISIPHRRKTVTVTAPRVE